MRTRIRRIPRLHKQYYWICAIDKVSGRPIVDGAYNSEQEAHQYGFSKNINGGDFEVCMFPTSNRIMARDLFKHKILDRTGDISTVFKRARYKV